MYKIDENWNINNCSCEKCLFGKLALAWEVEILNTSKGSLDDKNVSRKKLLADSHDIINSYMLVIIYLLVYLL